MHNLSRQALARNEMKKMRTRVAHGFGVYQSREGYFGSMIKCAGATRNAREKIKVHCADFDLFPGLTWLHSLREMQLNFSSAGRHPAQADGDLHCSLRASTSELEETPFAWRGMARFLSK